MFQTSGSGEDHDDIEKLDWRSKCLSTYAVTPRRQIDYGLLSAHHFSCLTHVSRFLFLKAFRAQLVLNEQNMDMQDLHDHDEDIDGIGSIFYKSQNGNKQTKNVSPGQAWGYDSGTIIETGSIILGGVEQDFGFGLQQQFFHKSVMLIIDHADTKFTKAVILNRPTDLCLVDNDGNEWNVW